MKVFAIEYLEVGMDFMYQIHSITDSEDYAKDVCIMLMERDDVSEAGYSDWEVVQLKGEDTEEDTDTVSGEGT